MTNKNALYRFCKEATELSRGHLVQGPGETHILKMCHNCKRSHSLVSNGKDTLEKSRNQVFGQLPGKKFAEHLLKYDLSQNYGQRCMMVTAMDFKSGCRKLKCVLIFSEKY